jgi:hypothetical protein
MHIATQAPIRLFAPAPLTIPLITTQAPIRLFAFYLMTDPSIGINSNKCTK